MEIGDVVKASTEPDDLVITSLGALDPRFPNLLYHAQRNGWSIFQDSLSGPLCRRLMEEGASYLVTLRHDEHEGEIKHFTDALPGKKVVPVRDGWEVFLYRLEAQYIIPKDVERP